MCNDFDTGLDAPQSPSDIGPSGSTEDFESDNHPPDNPAHRNPSLFDMPPGNIEDLWLQNTIYLDDLIMAAEFIKGLQGATLDDPSLGMSDKALQHLQNPPYEQSPRVIDKVPWLVIDLYVGTPLEATYVTVHKAILCFLLDLELPSYYKIKCLVADLTGIESVMHHICVNFCIAYTGPFLDLEACPVCSEPWYDQFHLQSGPGGEKIPH